jgi:hypothetical protein
MMRPRLQVLFVTLGGVLSVAILANASKISGQPSAITSDETVVNVSYSAQRRFTSVAKAAAPSLKAEDQLGGDTGYVATGQLHTV